MTAAAEAPGPLTATEHAVIDLTSRLFDAVQHVVFPGPSHDDDLREIAMHIHAVQNAVLAQAAARAYPDRYTLLGQTVQQRRVEVLD